MLDDATRMASMLEKYPDLVNDVTTGGAQPLHMCGMSRGEQHAARYLVERGADIEALDTYGMTPLQRMASNNLAAGARTLLEAGADVTNEGKCGRSPLRIARGSAANAVVEVLMPYLNEASVRMSDCVRGIEPCECKGKGHRFRRVGLLGCFSLVKMMRRERKE
jgi:ankyrin repeat protein